MSSWLKWRDGLVSNPQEDGGSQVVSAGGHRPKNTFLSHCFHMAAKCVVKLRNWGRGGWFLSMFKDELFAFYSVCSLYFLIQTTWGYLQFKGANVVLTVPCLAACSTKKYFFWLPSSLFAFLFPVLFLDTRTRCHAGLSGRQSFVWQHELHHFLGAGELEWDTSGVILLQWMGV